MTARILLLAAALALAPAGAHAWSAKLHVYAANETLRDVLDDQQVGIGAYGSYPVDTEVVDAMTQFPEFFRGGAVGPDGYPDIFTGQVYTHPDQSAGLVQALIDGGVVTCSEAYAKGWCGRCEATTRCADPRDDDVPLYFSTRNGPGQRPKRFWRSVDWCRTLVEAAWKEIGDAHAGRSDASVQAAARLRGTTVVQEARKALAYAYGYLSHFAGDGFGHNWVNLYAGGSWNYWDEHPEYEYRHVVVERYAVYLMNTGGDPLPADTTATAVDAPEWFVEKYLMRAAVSGADSAAKGSAHIRYLYGYRDLLLRVKSALNMPDTLDAYPEDGVGPRAFDANDPQSYSSAWSYLLNHCFDTMIAGALTPERAACVEDLYKVVFAGYVNSRLRAVDDALLSWVTLSTNINRQVLADQLSVKEVTALLDDYFTNKVIPLVVPGADEPIRQYFALSCADVGPPNFSRICETMVAQVRQVVEDELDLTEAVLRAKFTTYLDAYRRMLCTFDEYLEYWMQPELLMNVAYCDGNEQACPLAAHRKDQVRDDLFLVGTDPRTFLPFSNTVQLSKLLMLTQADMLLVGTQANALPISAAMIDLGNAPFIRSDTYETLVWESVASLDGTEPINEESTTWEAASWASPPRVLFDQFRKAPVFALVRSEPERLRIHWPHFGIGAQDPDGDQIYMAYDLCPCLPQTRGENAKDQDGDGVGDACDAKYVFPQAADAIRAMPDEGFGPPALGVKVSYTNRLQNTVAPQCMTSSAADAAALLHSMYVEMEAHVANGVTDAATGAAVLALLDELRAKLEGHAMQCADSQPPGKATSCQ